VKLKKLKSIMKFKFSCFKKDKWCGKAEQSILWILFGVMIAILSIASFFSFDDKIINIIKALGSLMLVVSLGIAANQFRLNRKQFEKNNEWNKKQLAMTQAHTVLDNITKHIEVINPILNYRERKKNKATPYSVAEIHNAMGIFMEDGSFVFHGQHSKDDYKNLPREQKDEHIIHFIDEIDGLAVKDSIYGLLNEYEYLAAGVNNDILDEDVIKSLMCSPIRDAFRLFEVYINHVIKKHDGNENMYLQIRNFIANNRC